MIDRIIPQMLAPAPDPVAKLRGALADLHDASIAFHFSADYIDTPFHVSMWAPHLEDAGVAWYVICRERHHHAALLQAGVRSVLAPGAHLLPLAVGRGVKAILYANNAHRNIDMLRRFPRLTHVQMLHGDSDKPPSFSPVTANFDKIFVAGQLGQDRYARNGVILPEDAFVHVGRPQVKGRAVGQRPSWRDGPVIAYMPTWLGGQAEAQFSSLDRAGPVLRAIRAASPEAEILFKPHPLSYKDPSWKLLEPSLRAVMREIGATAIDRRENADRIYERADLLVTDISSTMADFLHADRPLAVILPRRVLRDRDRAFPMLPAVYAISGDLADISARLSDALGPDSLKDRRRAMRTYAFGADERPADARFIAAIRQLAGEHHG